MLLHFKYLYLTLICIMFVYVKTENSILILLNELKDVYLHFDNSEIIL